MTLNLILVPLDGSSLAERALSHLVAITRAFEPQVILIRVLDPYQAASLPGSVDPVDWQIRKAEAESYLEGIATQLMNLGLQVTYAILEGKAADSVVEFAHTRKVDLILLSSHGQSGISGWNVSSVVQKIILRANTSIMIVRSYKTTPIELNALSYQRIVVPLDGSQRAEGVLPLATTLAQTHNAQLLITHIIKKPEMPRRTPLGKEETELIDEIVERNRVEASRYLAETKSRLLGDVDTRLLVSDSLTGSLHDLVEQVEADLVILSAHGFSARSKWPYGSLVVSLIAYGTTPLLIAQDMAMDRIEPSAAELAAEEMGRP